MSNALSRALEKYRPAEVQALLQYAIERGPAPGRTFRLGWFGVVQAVCVGKGWSNADSQQPKPGSAAAAARQGAWLGSVIDVAVFVPLNDFRHRLFGTGPVAKTRMDQVKVAMTTPGDFMGFVDDDGDHGRLWPKSLEAWQPNLPRWLEQVVPALGSTGACEINGRKPPDVKLRAKATFRATRGSGDVVTVDAPVVDAGDEFRILVSPPRKSTYLFRDAGTEGWKRVKVEWGEGVGAL